MNKLRNILISQFKYFDGDAFVHSLKIFSVFAMGIIVYASIYSGFQIVDEFEHLHASWLVSIGKLPYRDFLEHHNPLLWYLSAPIVHLFFDNVLIFYVMRFISALASLLIGFYIYKITLFWSDKKGAWLTIALYLGNMITLYCFYQYRPDTYMNLCFIAGIYYLLQALKTNRSSLLLTSFLCFTFSFLFLQKISLLLLAVCFILLWLIGTKKLRLKTVVFAAFPSVLILFCFLGFFYFKGAFIEYFDINYHLNRIMLSYYERGTFWYKNIFLSLYGFAFVTAVLFYKKRNIYFKITSLLFIAEFLMRGFYFSPYTHYYSLITVLSSLILSVYADKLFPTHKFFGSVLVIVLFLNLGHLFNKLEVSIPNHNSFKHYELAKWAHKNSQPDDMFMNGYDMIFNIYRPDVSYYWFQLDTLVPIMEKEYNLKHKIDVNEIIITQKPRFVYAADYPNLMAVRYYGENKYAQKFIPELIKALYKPTPFDGLWERK